MNLLTPQEKHILAFLAVVITAGSGMQFVQKRQPEVFRYINFIDEDRMTAKVDINTASFDVLVDLPYVGEFTANAIIGRRKRELFKTVDEIAEIKGIRRGNFEKFSEYLTVRQGGNN